MTKMKMHCLKPQSLQLNSQFNIIFCIYIVKAVLRDKRLFEDIQMADQGQIKKFNLKIALIYYFAFELD